MELELIRGTFSKDLPCPLPRIDKGKMGEPVSEYLDRVRRGLLDRGLLASTFVLDGEPLAPETESQVGNLPADDFQSLTVQVEEAAPFVGEIFRGCADSVPNLIALGEEITGAVHAGEISMLLQLMEKFSDGLDVLVSAYRAGVHILERTGIAGASDLAEGQERLQVLEVDVRELLSGIQNRDVVLMSDVLQYEVPEHLRTLEREFRYWSEQLQGSCSSLQGGKESPAGG